MSLTAEHIIDRRHMKRKISFWRIVALLLLALVVVSFIALSGGFSSISETRGDHIARVRISGVILHDGKMLKLLKSLGDNSSVKAVIINISSPGGSTTGGEELYDAIRKLAEKKPVVATVGTLAASAGYMIAIASDHIVAHRTSIVGSIGVLFQYVDASELLGKIGVKVNAIKSSPMKAEPSPFQPANPQALVMIDRAIQDTYQWFKGLVAERRNMSSDQVNQLSDGSIFTGKQALDNGLIDAIGDEDIAVEWLTKEKKIPADLKVEGWEPEKPNRFGFGAYALLNWIGRYAGFSMGSDYPDLMKMVLPEEQSLEGLVSRMVNIEQRRQGE